MPNLSQVSSGKSSIKYAFILPLSKTGDNATLVPSIKAFSIKIDVFTSSGLAQIAKKVCTF